MRYHHTVRLCDLQKKNDVKIEEDAEGDKNSQNQIIFQGDTYMRSDVVKGSRSFEV